MLPELRGHLGLMPKKCDAWRTNNLRCYTQKRSVSHRHQLLEFSHLNTELLSYNQQICKLVPLLY